MPGIEARAPERTDTSSGLARSPNCRPVMRATWARPGVDLLLQFLRIFLRVGVVVRADRGGDGEARRHRQAEVRHLGEVGALAAEQVFHAGAALRLAAAEDVDPLAFAARCVGGCAGGLDPRFGGFASRPIWPLASSRRKDGVPSIFSLSQSGFFLTLPRRFLNRLFLLTATSWRIARPRTASLSARLCPGHPRLAVMPRRGCPAQGRA